MLQSRQELEEWHSTKDPWKYEEHPDDAKRRDILLSELPERDYQNVLDIGCGQGFVTRHLPGKKILAVDIAEKALQYAQEQSDDRITYRQASIFDLAKQLDQQYDLIVLSGMVYPQYIGDSLSLVYLTIDQLLAAGGILASVHINSWYKARFPYLLLKEYYYDYREYVHRLEVYVK